VRVESPGWRYLDEGEMVKAGDMIANAEFAKHWINVCSSIGGKVSVLSESGKYVFRRKISPV